MTVKEYIERLSKLNQDSNIWILRDDTYWLEPPTEEEAKAKWSDEIDREGMERRGVNEDDYFIRIG